MHCHYGIRSQRPSALWFWGPNSIIVVYMDPLVDRIVFATPDDGLTAFGRGVSDAGWCHFRSWKTKP